MFYRHLALQNLWRERWGLVKHWNGIWLILTPSFSISDKNIKSDLMQFILQMKQRDPKLGRKPIQCHKICTFLTISWPYIRHDHYRNPPGIDSSLLFTCFPYDTTYKSFSVLACGKKSVLLSREIRSWSEVRLKCKNWLYSLLLLPDNLSDALGFVTFIFI